MHCTFSPVSRFFPCFSLFPLFLFKTRNAWTSTSSAVRFDMQRLFPNERHLSFQDDPINLPGWRWARIMQLVLVGSSSSLHSEACNALGGSDGVAHSKISLNGVTRPRGFQPQSWRALRPRRGMNGVGLFVFLLGSISVNRFFSRERGNLRILPNLEGDEARPKFAENAIFAIFCQNRDVWFKNHTRIQTVSEEDVCDT